MKDTTTFGSRAEGWKCIPDWCERLPDDIRRKGPYERFAHLREQLSFLAYRGVTALMTMTQHGVVGGLEVPLDVSYVADTVILLRYCESSGEVRQAISVIKKRTGNHERTLREYYFDKGIEFGEPLLEFQGILTGVPDYLGQKSTAAPSAKDDRKHES